MWCGLCVWSSVAAQHLSSVNSSYLVLCTAHHAAIYAHTQILDEGSNLCPIHSCKDSAQGVSDIMYSPNNRFMAASTYDTWIDIYK